MNPGVFPSDCMARSVALRILAEAPCRPNYRIRLYSERLTVEVAIIMTICRRRSGSFLGRLEARPHFVPIAACAAWPGRGEHDVGDFEGRWGKPNLFTPYADWLSERHTHPAGACISWRGSDCSTDGRYHAVKSVGRSLAIPSVSASRKMQLTEVIERGYLRGVASSF